MLVHIGHQEWLLVDSCLDFASRQPAPLAYLRSIGVNPSEADFIDPIRAWYAEFGGYIPDPNEVSMI